MAAGLSGSRRTLGSQANAFASLLGIELMDWQRYVLDECLRLDDSGNFAASEVGLLIARQNGKSFINRVRILFGMYVLGERWVGMAQKLELAESHLEWAMKAIEASEELSAEIAKISRTNGRKFIELKNGGRWEVCAATADSVRGKTGNLWVDELREIPPEAWSAATPITRAVANSQIYVSSNAGDINSTVLNRFRAGALAADSPRSLWLEWSADPALSIFDPVAWAQANPSMNYRISQEKIELASKKDTVAEFKTESLSSWVDSLISPWGEAALRDSGRDKLEIEPGKSTYLGLDITPDRRRGDLVGVQELATGELAIFPIAAWESDTSIDDLKVASDVAEIARTFETQVIAYDKWTCAAVAGRLQFAGFQLKESSGTTFAQACDETLNALNAGRLAHDRNAELLAHFNSCARKPLADGGWRVIRSKSTANISIACAAIMAIHHASAQTAEVSIDFF